MTPDSKAFWQAMGVVILCGMLIALAGMIDNFITFGKVWP